MSETNPMELLERRITALEEARRELEKRLYAAFVVAGVLGLSGILGGAWLGSTASRLEEVSERTSKLESSLQQWNDLVASGVKQLQDATTSLKEDLQRAGERATQSALHRLRDVKPVQLLSALQDGTAQLRVSGIQIVNQDRDVVVKLGSSDSDGGFIFLGDNTGDERMELSVNSGEPLETMWGSKSNNAQAQFGIYSDLRLPFIRFFDQQGKTPLLVLQAEESGGALFEYGKTGNRIVFAGPNSDNSNGLVRVDSDQGGAAQSLSP